MKILVVGSEGRIMSNTIPHLLQSGHEIVGVDSCEKWGHQDTSRPYAFFKADAKDVTAMRPLLRNTDGVIQAAATLLGVTGFHRRGADILTNDLAIQQNILGLSAEVGVRRVVYLSSSMVYETCGTPHREDDIDDTITPRTDYGLSKLVGERLSKAYWRQYNLAFMIWRPFNVIDPREEGTSDPGVSHVFADLIYRIIACQQNPLDILGDGEQVRSFVHIDEVGAAIAKFSFDDRTLCGTFNLGRNEPVTMSELARTIYRKACERGLITNLSTDLSFNSLPVPTTDVRRRIGAFEKMESCLGWKSAIGLNTALDDCLNAFEGKS